MEGLIKDCTGLILAGGENRRMPVTKSLIEVDGQRIIERNLKIIKDLFKEVIILTNQPEIYSYLAVPMVGDVYDIRGPMTGIFSGLLHAPDPWVFVSACDMPFLNPKLIAYLASKRAHKDAVLPVVRRRPEPLFAFYSKGLLGAMEKALLSGKKSMKDFSAGKRVEYISTGEIRKRDPDRASFINLNTPEDVEEHLQPEDITRFRKKAERRGKCLV